MTKVLEAAVQGREQREFARLRVDLHRRSSEGFFPADGAGHVGAGPAEGADDEHGEV